VSGYCSCPCRDCFEIAIDGLCLDCLKEGCDESGESECQAASLDECSRLEALRLPNADN
jgi:hypothetical protein